VQACLAEFVAFGDAKNKALNLLLTSCASGAEHFDMLIPSANSFPGAPLLTIRREYFMKILRGDKSFEFRSDVPRLRTQLRSSSILVLRAGRTPGFPYMVVEVAKQRRVPLEEVKRFHGEDIGEMFDHQTAVLGIKLGRILEVWDPTGFHFFRLDFASKISPGKQLSLTDEQKLRTQQVPLSFKPQNLLRRQVRALPPQSLEECFARLPAIFGMARKAAGELEAHGHKPLLWQNRSLFWRRAELQSFCIELATCRHMS